MEQISIKELHNIEMEMVYLLENNELTRDFIINSFTDVYSKLR